VRSGPHPAKLRLTILTGSSRVDTFSGRDLPGTYTCCTARFVGKAFRPRPNAVTTKRVNVKVVDVRDKRLRFRLHSSDGVALTAVGPGTLPLQVRDDVGAFNPGIPMAVGYWPFTQVGEPRPADGYSMTGIGLMFQWNFMRRQPRELDIRRERGAHEPLRGPLRHHLLDLGRGREPRAVPGDPLHA
jgi:hypothetical protein